MSASTTSSSTRELAHRVGAGIEVTLLWDPTENSTSIALRHAATDQTLHFEVPRELALDAFYHPLVHLQMEVAACASR
jgi:hypothetical protein